MTNKPLHLEPADGIFGPPIKLSKKRMKCKKKYCQTIINGYRQAAGNIYCTVHEHIGIKKADIEEVEILIQRSREQTKKKSRKIK